MNSSIFVNLGKRFSASAQGFLLGVGENRKRLNAFRKIQEEEFKKSEKLKEGIRWI